MKETRDYVSSEPSQKPDFFQGSRSLHQSPREDCANADGYQFIAKRKKGGNNQ